MSIKINFNPTGRREALYMVLGAFVVLASLSLDLAGFREQGPWFQRSGALLVIIGAISESKHIEKVISPNKGATGEHLTRKQKFINHSGFAMAFLGTLIWGYGDLVL